MAQRASDLVKAIKHLDTIKDGEQYRTGLVTLKNCLDSCVEFIKTFSKDANWFKQALKAGTHEKKFAELNSKLEKAIAQLNLGINAQQIIIRITKTFRIRTRTRLVLFT